MRIAVRANVAEGARIQIQIQTNEGVAMFAISFFLASLGLIMGISIHDEKDNWPKLWWFCAACTWVGIVLGLLSIATLLWRWMP